VLVVLEGYSYGSKNQAHQIGEWGGLLRWTLWGARTQYIEVPPTTLKAYVAGAGNAPKEVMMREVFRRWNYEAVDNDDADAFGLAQFGLEFLSDKRTKRFDTLVGKIEIVQVTPSSV
jgi:crossover junction endodeoxyribonuclease RuvC